MLYPYAKIFTFTTTAINQIVKLAYPARCVVQRVNVYRSDTGAIAATFYSRAFTGSAKTFTTVTDSGVVVPSAATHYVQFNSTEYLCVRPGDTITVACASAAGYAGSQKVLYVLNGGKTIVTDKVYAADALGGTITLAIPDAARPVYQVAAAITGTTSATTTTAFAYANQDVLPTGDSVGDQAIYVMLADVGSYQINIISGVAAVGM